jgi:hypothetical protein
MSILRNILGCASGTRSRPTPSPSWGLRVGNHKKELQLRLEQLLFSGCRKVPDGVSVKVRSLTPEEMATIKALQAEIRRLR